MKYLFALLIFASCAKQPVPTEQIMPPSNIDTTNDTSLTQGLTIKNATAEGSSIDSVRIAGQLHKFTPITVNTQIHINATCADANVTVYMTVHQINGVNEVDIYENGTTVLQGMWVKSYDGKPKLDSTVFNHVTLNESSVIVMIKE